MFSTASSRVTELSELGPKRKDVLNRVAGVFPNGGTRLIVTVAEEYQRMEQQPSGEQIRALVVLSDGADNESTGTAEQLTSILSADEAGTSINVFAIAYGTGFDVDRELMKAIAEASGAKSSKCISIARPSALSGRAARRSGGRAHRRLVAAATRAAGVRYRRGARGTRSVAGACRRGGGAAAAEQPEISGAAGRERRLPRRHRNRGGPLECAVAALAHRDRNTGRNTGRRAGRAGPCTGGKHELIERFLASADRRGLDEQISRVEVQLPRTNDPYTRRQLEQTRDALTERRTNAQALQTYAERIGAQLRNIGANLSNVLAETVRLQTVDAVGADSTGNQVAVRVRDLNARWMRFGVCSIRRW